MKNATKRIISITLCLLMLAVLIPAIQPEPVQATNHGEYDTLAMIYDYGSCPSMQGLGLCGDYFYAVKTDGDDYAATVTRVNKNTGAKSMMVNGGNGTYYFYDFGHGNDCEVVVAGGKTNMFIPTSATGANSLVRYTISGTTATKMCGYQMVSPSGANIGGGAVRVARVDDENIYLLFKSGMTMYTGTLPINQNGGQLVMTKMCTLDTSGVYVNGSYMDLSSFIGQGMGYYDHHVYIPISGNSNTSTINQSIILVYDLQGATGTIKPLNDPTFRVTSSAYSALYEIETCVIDPETNLLYFTTNRRKTSSDTNYDGLHWITNWVYEPNKRTTEVENYRWETIDNKLVSVTTGSSVFNGLAHHGGSVSGDTITDGRFTTDKNIVLKHANPWVVEWKSNGGTSAGELLLATQSVSNYTDAPYIFISDNNAQVFMGAYNGSQYNNYGINLSTYGISGKDAHTYRLTNKIASDGSNMVYLSVDGKELGALNNYHIASTSQGTTSNWISGQDFAFSYLGTNNHPINESIEYIQVWANGIPGQVDEPDIFRWETSDSAISMVSDFGMTENGLTAISGSISGGVHSSVQLSPAKDIVLLHDRPWSIEWAGTYSSGAMLLAADHMGNTDSAPYLFRSGILAFGERKASTHNNYGVKLSDYGISYADQHTYRLTNRIESDGSNMVYLYVDGVEISAMNHYYKGTTDQGTTVDWLNGRDLTFSYLGTYQYRISGTLDYLQIWEGGIPADDEADNFRWETQTDAFVNLTGDNLSENTATALAGTIADGTFTSSSYFRLDESVVLLHNRPWTVQWESEGDWSGSGAMLFAASNINNLTNAPYLYRRPGSGFIVLGHRKNSAHHNYGVMLSDYGIDGTARHTYTLTNKIAADGSNMIYLSVDGKEIAPMNHYYQGVTDQGTTSDWVSGKDFVFSYMGMKNYSINGCTLDYVQVWENCSHSFGAWVVNAATCTAGGSRTRTCVDCGYAETETIAPLGHSYDQVSYAADCKNYERIEFICSSCGDCYITYPDSLYSAWSETAPSGIDQSLIQTKTQYRYSDYETTTSYATALDGYTQIGSTWVQSGTTTVNYVNSWDSGFNTSNSLYTQYNKKSSKVTASETTTTKTVINSDAIVGYLWFHWCPNSGIYSTQTKTGTYTNFHAFYSTTYTTSNYDDYDSSDGSYCLNSATACSHSTWYWPVAVYAQKSTSYQNLFTYERWTDYSVWSDEEVTASDTRKVESRTMYRYVTGELGDHNYVDGACTVCGGACSHSYSSVVTAPTCTGAGFTTHTCTLCGYSYTNNIVSARHSYSAHVTAPTCIDAGFTTYTCTECGDSYISDTVAALGHSYSSKTTAATCTTAGKTTYTCGNCGDSYSEPIAALGHNYKATTTNPTCTASGKTTYTCGNCGGSYSETIAALGHSYSSKTTAATCTADGKTVYTCGNCGDSYSETIAALGHSYSSKTTAATCTVDGKTVYTCGNCGDSYEEVIPATGHSYVGGTCQSCGEAEPSTVVKPTMTVTGTSLSFEDEIFYNIYYTVDDASSVVEMGLVTFTEKLADGTHENAVDIIPGYVSGGGEYMVHTNGIPAKNMGDAVYFRIYAKLTDGSYVYGDVAGYHAVAYAKSILAKSTNANMKALVVAMVNYGAEAQLYFGYNTDSLMNSFLTAEQQALVAAYDESMIASVVSADSAKTAAFPKTTGAFKVSTSVSFDGAFSVNYYFTPGFAIDGDMTLYYWDAATYASADALTKDNATSVMTMTLAGSEYWGVVAGIAAKEIDQTIYVAAVYESNGVEYTSGVTAYSLGHYCKTQAAKETSAMKDFAAATGVYGYYAKQYFASIA